MEQNITYNVDIIINKKDFCLFSGIELPQLISFMQNPSSSMEMIKITTLINGIFNKENIIS